MKDKSKSIILSIIFCILTIFCILSMVLYIDIKSKNIYLENQNDFYMNLSLREGEIVAVYDSVVYVYDDVLETVIEVDIFDELVHTKIEVGDLAIYSIDYDATDADLINIVKKENKWK